MEELYAKGYTGCEIALQEGAALWLSELPSNAKGTVIICPGGGYQWLSPREAGPVATVFIQDGWQAAVLQYSVCNSLQPPLGQRPLRQLGQAVEIVRQRNGQKPVFVCGFSAGGHLAASLGVHWQHLGLPRPDGMILSYPVITMGSYTHTGTRNNVAGEDEAARAFFSIENHVGSHTPPVFLWHTVTDPSVPVQNALLLAQALTTAGCSYEMHLFPKGGHGLSLATPEVAQPEAGRYPDPHVAEWMHLCLGWMNQQI
jgi:acetyl esterase/lipase